MVTRARSRRGLRLSDSLPKNSGRSLRRQRSDQRARRVSGRSAARLPPPPSTVAAPSARPASITRARCLPTKSRGCRRPLRCRRQSARQLPRPTARDGSRSELPHRNRHSRRMSQARRLRQPSVRRWLQRSAGDKSLVTKPAWTSRLSMLQRARARYPSVGPSARASKLRQNCRPLPSRWRGAASRARARGPPRRGPHRVQGPRIAARALPPRRGTRLPMMIRTASRRTATAATAVAWREGQAATPTAKWIIHGQRAKCCATVRSRHQTRFSAVARLRRLPPRARPPARAGRQPRQQKIAIVRTTVLRTAWCRRERRVCTPAEHARQAPRARSLSAMLS